MSQCICYTAEAGLCQQEEADVTRAGGSAGPYQQAQQAGCQGAQTLQVQDHTVTFVPDHCLLYATEAICCMHTQQSMAESTLVLFY